MIKARLIAIVTAVAAACAAVPSRAQDMTGLDVTSDAFTKSEMTRSQIEKAISELRPGELLDLEGVVLDQAWALKSDWSGATLKKSSLFATQFGGSKLDGANFSQARVAADFTNASATNAVFNEADLSADEKN